MLVGEQRGDGDQPGEVDRAQLRGGQAEGDERGEGHRVARRREPECPADAETGWQAVQAGGAVEVGVLAGVQQVEPAHPEQHRRAEDERRGHVRPRDDAADGDPGGDRGEGQRRAEPEVRQAREPFGERVRQHDAQHRQGQVGRPRVRRLAQEEQPGRGQECGTRHDREQRHGGDAERAGGEVPAGGPRVAAVVVAVGQAVERHRRRAGGHHARQNAHEVEPAEHRFALPGE